MLNVCTPYGGGKTDLRLVRNIVSLNYYGMTNCFVDWHKVYIFSIRVNTAVCCKTCTCILKFWRCHWKSSVIQYSRTLMILLNQSYSSVFHLKYTCGHSNNKHSLNSNKLKNLIKWFNGKIYISPCSFRRLWYVSNLHLTKEYLQLLILHIFVSSKLFTCQPVCFIYFLLESK